MRFFVQMIATVLLGLVAGGASAMYLSGLLPGIAGPTRSMIDISGWRADFSIGAEQTNPWTRTRVARHGLLALAQSEAVYFTRTTDDAGGRLSERCRYRLTGTDQDALWWSVTLYDAENRLPMNSDRALSFDRTRAGERANWSVAVQSTPPEDGAWISSRAGGAFDLTLRLYRPAKSVLTHPQASFRPPGIERLSCEGETS